MRLTLDEYSKHFKMSKEMIHSKLRAKKLNYIIENGITYIIVTKSSLEKEKHQEIDEEQKAATQRPKKVLQAKKVKTTVSMILGLYQKENQQLKEKIIQLEAKIDKLVNDKEQMLRDEVSKIEHLYTSKDEQLKTILELINTKLLIENENTIHEVDTITVTQEPDKDIEKKEKKEEIVELKKYLKSLDLENYQQKIIKKRFLAVYGKDVRVIKQNGKIYLDFSKYDYSDLLEY
jgi:hypothetical protein